MRRPYRPPLHGFTLVELLVYYDHRHLDRLVAAGGAGGARSSAKTQCGNNLKQIGLAMHAYHEAHGSFPPGDISTYALSSPCVAAPPGLRAGYCGWGWGTFILPYVEQQAVYDRV